MIRSSFVAAALVASLLGSTVAVAQNTGPGGAGLNSMGGPTNNNPSGTAGNGQTMDPNGTGGTNAGANGTGMSAPGAMNGANAAGGGAAASTNALGTAGVTGTVGK